MNETAADPLAAPPGGQPIAIRVRPLPRALLLGVAAVLAVAGGAFGAFAARAGRLAAVAGASADALEQPPWAWAGAFALMIAGALAVLVSLRLIGVALARLEVDATGTRSVGLLRTRALPWGDVRRVAWGTRRFEVRGAGATLRVHAPTLPGPSLDRWLAALPAGTVVAADAADRDVALGRRRGALAYVLGVLVAWVMLLGLWARWLP